MPTLADLHGTDLTCPAPIPCPPREGWDLAIEVPAEGWPPGTRVDLHVRPGIIDLPGGGACGILTGQALSLDGQTSTQVELPQPPACVAVAEPSIAAGLILGLLLVVLITRRRSRWGSRSSNG